MRRDKIKCRRCRKEYAARAYPVPGFRTAADTWRSVAGTFLRERSSLRVAEESGLSPKTAQLATYRIGEAPARDPVSGTVEMDETHIGGQRKNKRLHIRRLSPAKRGHDTDKLPIVGLFSRETGQVWVEVEPRKLDMAFVAGFVRRHVATGSTVCTGGFKMHHDGLWGSGHAHRWVDHAGGELARGDVHTNNTEGLWGLLKRRMGCIGGMRRDRLNLFVGETVWRFNHRRLAMADTEKRLLEVLFGDRFGGKTY